MHGGGGPSRRVPATAFSTKTDAENCGRPQLDGLEPNSCAVSGCIEWVAARHTSSSATRLPTGASETLASVEPRAKADPMTADDFAPIIHPQPLPVVGGPCDGSILPAHHERYWVLHTPGSGRELIVDGDLSVGGTLYSILWDDRNLNVLSTVRGVYYRPRNPRYRRRYLDLQVGPGTPAQHRFARLAYFLMSHHMLVHAADWWTRRPDWDGAKRVSREWRFHPDVLVLTMAYLEYELID